MTHRILWVGDAIAPTGFARVTHGVVDRLYAGGYQVGVLGLAYQGGPHRYPYPIWKADHVYEARSPVSRLDSPVPSFEDDPFGRRIIRETIKTFRPDLVVLFHDPWVVGRWIEEILKLKESDRPKILTYSPVDAEGLMDTWMATLNHADSVCVYTQFAVGQYREAGFEGKVHIIPHGVDLSTFKPIDKKSARFLSGLPQEKWIVLNPNRNQPRKRIDLTIKGFCQFAAGVKGEGGPQPLLHLHMLPIDAGWDLIPLLRRECYRHGLNMMDVFSITNVNQMPLSDAALNLLYNSADVGINTSIGEGWGLPSFEMAALGVPQIMTDFSAGRELFSGKAWMVPVAQKICLPKVGTDGGMVHEDSVAEALLDAYQNPKKGAAYAMKAKEMVSSDRFRWESVARQFDERIRSVLDQELSKK